MQAPLDRERRDALAEALVINAPYLHHIHDDRVVHDIIVESDAAVPMGTVQAVMLTMELAKVYRGEPLGHLAHRVAAALQNVVPNEQVLRLKTAMDQADPR